MTMSEKEVRGWSITLVVCVIGIVFVLLWSALSTPKALHFRFMGLDCTWMPKYDSKAVCYDEETKVKVSITLPVNKLKELQEDWDKSKQ